MPKNTMHIDVEYARARRRWVQLDAAGAVLGRLASKAAHMLRGKHKPFFSPSVDCGDFVIVTNAEKVRVTGRKEETKFYFSHSGHAKGKKVVPYRLQMMKDATKVISLAVKRMLPPNRLRSDQMRRLKVYLGAKHPHAAQMVEATK